MASESKPSSIPSWLRTALPWLIVAGLVWLLNDSVMNPLAEQVGMPAPPTVVQLTDGETFDLQAQDRVVVVNFWASYCPPCRAEIPDLQSVHTGQRGQAVVLGLAVDARSMPAAAGLGIHYPLALAPRDLVNAYGVTSLPSTFVIRADGTIHQTFVGGIHAAELEEAIAAASE